MERRRTAAMWFGCQGPCVSCQRFHSMIKHATARQSAPIDIGQGRLKNDSSLYSAKPTIKSKWQDKTTWALPFGFAATTMGNIKSHKRAIGRLYWHVKHLRRKWCDVTQTFPMSFPPTSKKKKHSTKFVYSFRWITMRRAQNNDEPIWENMICIGSRIACDKFSQRV